MTRKSSALASRGLYYDGDLAVSGLPRAWRALKQSLATGAMIVEARWGHRPIWLLVGGLIVWAFCVGFMLGDGSAFRVVDRAVVGMIDPSAGLD